MRKRNRKVKKMQVMSLAGLLVAGLAAGNLPAEPVSAANGWDISLDVGGDVKQASSVAITIEAGSDNVMLVPKSSTKSAGVIKRTASVEIGATDGYTITVSGSPNLTGNNANNKISSVSSATTLQQMSNQWGWYNADGDVDCNGSGTFRAMTSAGEIVSSGSLDAKTTKQFTMCFGAKVNTNQAVDNYSSSVVISAVAQPKSITAFNGIKTMQAMTSSICKAASENDTAYLRDTRDNKSYWVTKLKDGNCWMSQNLALDLSTSKTLTSVDSDVTTNWTPGRSTTSSITTGSTSNAETYSWNLGAYVISNPSDYSSCSNSIGLSACTGTNQFTAVGDRTPSTNPNFYKDNGSKTYTSTEYDAHYLAGNYYQWNAATAGTGATTSGNAAGSICPKNWKLPNSGTTGTDLAKNSFIYLLSRYGLAPKDGGSRYTGSTGVSPVDNNTYGPLLSPLFFVGAGSVISGRDAPLAGASQGGNYWSSLANGASQAYEINFYNNYYILPINVDDRYYGLPVRCLVPTT